MTSPWFSLNLLNADLDASLSLFLLMLILSTTPLFLMLFLNSVLNILIIKFTYPLIICFARINLLFCFSLFELADSGIPIWFRCFKGKHNPQAYSFDIIKEGISYCANLFSSKNYHIIFLADRWFPHVQILSHIQSIGCFYCIRAKSFFSYSYYDSTGKLCTSHLRDIKPHKHDAVVISDALFTRNLFKTNIVVSRSCVSDESWYLVTNDNTARAVRNYSYRFGSIECIFKNQKSNRF